MSDQQRQLDTGEKRCAVKRIVLLEGGLVAPLEHNPASCLCALRSFDPQCVGEAPLVLVRLPLPTWLARSGVVASSLSNGQ